LFSCATVAKLRPFADRLNRIVQSSPHDWTSPWNSEPGFCSFIHALQPRPEALSRVTTELLRKWITGAGALTVTGSGFTGDGTEEWRTGAGETVRAAAGGRVAARDDVCELAAG